MLTVPGLIVGAKIAGWFLAAVMAVILAMQHSGRKAGHEAASRAALAKTARQSREISRADAAGARTRDDVVDRLRRGGF